MQTQVESAEARYFRCLRLAATITPGQCRLNRARCELLGALFADLGQGETGEPLSCLDCPQAAEVDAGRVRRFTQAEVLSGRARAESPPGLPLPWETRESARPSDKHNFTSAFWVPAWDPLAAAAPASAPAAGLRVELFTNAVAGGWQPAQLEQALGGSEEAIVLWARALARLGAQVTVFHSPPPGAPAECADGPVRYRPRAAFDPLASRDALVTWKDPRPWLVGARAARRIHWSSDVEAPWPAGLAERLHAWVALGAYHASRVPWVPRALLRVVPHGIDRAALEAGRCARVPGRALYASSPDRGLERVLLDWPRLRERHPGLALHVTYGWARFAACAAAAPPAVRARAERFRARIMALARQPGVTWLDALPRAAMAREYWRAQWWLLPLEQPDAELFCLNALKARHTGAVPVIHRRGALEDTVDAWHPYDRFLATPACALGAPLRAAARAVPVLDWDQVAALHWLPLLTGDAT